MVTNKITKYKSIMNVHGGKTKFWCELLRQVCSGSYMVCDLIINHCQDGTFVGALSSKF